MQMAGLLGLGERRQLEAARPAARQLFSADYAMLSATLYRGVPLPLANISKRDTRFNVRMWTVSTTHDNAPQRSYYAKRLMYA